MNKTMWMLFLWGMSVSTAAFAAKPAGYDPQAACERYAQEDQIKSEHMADYMQHCLRDLTQDQDDANDVDLAPMYKKFDPPNPVKPK